MKNILFFLSIALITSNGYAQHQKQTSSNSRSIYVDSAIYYFNKSKTANGIDSLVFVLGLRMMDSLPTDANSVKRIEKAAEDFKGLKKSFFYNKIQESIFNAFDNAHEYYKEIDYGKAIINRYDAVPNPDDRTLFLIILTNLRIPFRVSDKLDEGFDFYTTKLKLYLQRNDSAAISTCYYVHGGFYNVKGLYDLSIYYYKKSIPYLDVSDTTDNTSFVGRNGWKNNTAVVGMVYNSLGDYRNAILYCRAAMNFGTHTRRDSTILPNIYIYTSYAKIMLNEPDSVIDLLNEAIKIAAVIIDPTLIADGYMVKGIYYQKFNQPDSSEFYLQECNKVIDKYNLDPNSTSGTINPNYYLALLRIKQNRFKDAEELLKSEIPKLANLRGDKMNEYKLLVEVYYKLGDLENANASFNRYKALQEQLQEDERKNRKMSFETEQKIADAESVITNLTSEKKIAALSRNFLIAVTAFFLLLLFFIYRNNRLKQKSNKLLGIAKEKAEQSEKFKQQFLANMSHEIRTPMNAVMGMTNLLIEKNPRSDQFKYLDGIKKSSDNLLHIINDILDLSKIEVGKMELEQIDFSVRDVLEQVKQTLHHKAEEKGLELITDIDSKIPDVLIGDPTRLNQVLMNLAGNAIKFTERGSVALYLTPSPSPQEKESHSAEGGAKSPSPRGEGFRMRFSVEDTGIGIPKDKLQTVFESFSQAHSSDTRKYGGTGLGLTISRQLVELMGGTISIESEEGSGTAFSFEINYPVGSAERLREQELSEQIDGSILKGLKILVVDDNEYNRTVATDTLKSKADVEITEAHNGEEAIDMLTKKDFDVILMDVQMPLMNGYEATQYIREKFKTPKNQTPVIALTASVVRSDLDKCRAAGMNDYVPKPFKTSQLISAIAKAAGREIKFSDAGEIKIKTKNQAGIINRSFLEKFCEGNKEQMQKYKSMFTSSAPVLIEKVSAALAKNDFEEIASQIHGYKMKLIMMGMNESKDLAHKIEQQCREESITPELNENIQTLMSHIETAIIEVELS